MKEAPAHFHFLGICGTAMGSVAAALSERGFTVTGSDENVYPPMSTFLEQRNIALCSGYRAENIPAKADVVVIGNAIKRGNPEAEAVLNRKLFYLSLPEVLKNYFLRGRHNLVVTGTHGKTTTTALLAWIMEKVGRNPGYLIAGLPKNFGQGARLNDSKYFVIEGDEYDTAFFDKRSKFIHYLPELVIVNNIEFDHADIFRNLDEIKLSFRRLLNIVPQNGMVLLNGDDPNCVEVAKDCLAQMIEGAFKSFAGIARRLELRGEARGVKVIDDFGHHPTAIAQTLQALRQRYHGHRLWAVFEPRSNTTRRAIFQQQLPEALKLADGVFISQVARLEQIPEDERLKPERVVAAIAKAGRPAFYEQNADAIAERIVPLLRPKDVVVVFSNGGFDNIHEKLLVRLREL